MCPTKTKCYWEKETLIEKHNYQLKLDMLLTENFDIHNDLHYCKNVQDKCCDNRIIFCDI